MLRHTLPNLGVGGINSQSTINQPVLFYGDSVNQVMSKAIIDITKMQPNPNALIFHIFQQLEQSLEHHPTSIKIKSFCTPHSQAHRE
jgi:hypothetical protein